MNKKITDKKKLDIAIHALLQCVNPAGSYNPDRLQHAENCIENVSKIAKKALDKLGVDYKQASIDQ